MMDLAPAFACCIQSRSSSSSLHHLCFIIDQQRVCSRFISVIAMHSGMCHRHMHSCHKCCMCDRASTLGIPEDQAKLAHPSAATQRIEHVSKLTPGMTAMQLERQNPELIDPFKSS